jgi:AcrR family transcriptional regulator
MPVRDRILNAAFCAFMEKGYAGTSTLEIATRARVSKRELYQECAGKAGLLKDAIVARAGRMRLPLELPVANDSEALTKMLASFGTAMLRGLCDPAVQAVYRLAIEESANAPEVARLLDTAGRGANRTALARTLARAQKHGLIGAGDPAALAADFFALLSGDLLLRLLLRVTAPPTARALEGRATEATAKFLKLHPPARAARAATHTQMARRG